MTHPFGTRSSFSASPCFWLGLRLKQGTHLEHTYPIEEITSSVPTEVIQAYTTSVLGPHFPTVTTNSCTNRASLNSLRSFIPFWDLHDSFSSPNDICVLRSVLIIRKHALNAPVCFYFIWGSKTYCTITRPMRPHSTEYLNHFQVSDSCKTHVND